MTPNTTVARTAWPLGKLGDVSTTSASAVSGRGRPPMSFATVKRSSCAATVPTTAAARSSSRRHHRMAAAMTVITRIDWKLPKAVATVNTAVSPGVRTAGMRCSIRASTCVSGPRVATVTPSPRNSASGTAAITAVAVSQRPEARSSRNLSRSHGRGGALEVRARTTYSLVRNPDHADAARERITAVGAASARTIASTKAAAKTTSRKTAARKSIGEMNSERVRTA
ncbi:hypothetical protein [Sinomonas atrocyanea]